jgi:L-fuconolactonase
MIIDAHHHLWKYQQNEYGWMDDSMSVLKRDYLPADLEPELQLSGISGTVVVQARQSLEETRWLLELADKYSFIKGVVGWLDLRSAELDKQLKEFAAHPKMVGVRHVIHDEPDDNFMLRTDFMNGIAQLEQYKLVYDLLLYPKHLVPATELVKAFPRQRFVLDHLAKPFIKAGEIEPWKSDITSLAESSNVWCKISGMVTEASHDQWEINNFIPYMEVVKNAFGPERIMLGSDWPVCELAGDYEAVMNIPIIFSRHLKETEQKRVLRKNAIECYQLQTES